VASHQGEKVSYFTSTVFDCLLSLVIKLKQSGSLSNYAIGCSDKTMEIMSSGSEKVERHCITNSN
jgi:hypothetical protein